MCFGGGGGTDDSALKYQQNQDAQARADETARQGRIAQGRQQIDALFDRGETLTTPAVTRQVSKDPVTGYTIDPTQPGYHDFTQMPGVAQRMVPTEIQVSPGAYTKTGPAFDDAFYDQRRQAYIDNYTPQLTDQFAKARNDMSFALARAGITRSSAAADQVGRLNEADAVQSATVANQAEGQVNALRSKVEDNRANLVSQLQASADPGGTANLALARTQSLAAEPLTYSPLGDVFAGLSSGIGNFVQGARYQSILNKYPGLTAASALTGAGTGSGQGASIKP